MKELHKMNERHKMNEKVVEVFQYIIDTLPKFMEEREDNGRFKDAFFHFLPQLLFIKMILEETHVLKILITSEILEDLFAIVYVFCKDEDQSDLWDEINKYLRKIASPKKKAPKNIKSDNQTSGWINVIKNIGEEER